MRDVKAGGGSTPEPNRAHLNYEFVEVRCFTVKGVLTNSYFTVLLGS